MEMFPYIQSYANYIRLTVSQILRNSLVMILHLITTTVKMYERFCRVVPTVIEAKLCSDVVHFRVNVLVMYVNLFYFNCM